MASPGPQDCPPLVKLFEEIQRGPFEGTGRPEPLDNQLSGCWSRRVDRERRLVDQVFETKIRVLACRFLYD